jgi:Spy/CpxP family protein refolding chaperone
MKKNLLLIALLAGAISLSQAQQRPQGDPQEMAKRNLEMLDKRLSLTDDQKAKISAILQSRSRAVDSLRNAAGAQGDRQAMRSKMQLVQQENQQKIKEVLTDVQKKSYETLLTEQRNRMGSGGQRRIRERPAN